MLARAPGGPTLALLLALLAGAHAACPFAKLAGGASDALPGRRALLQTCPEDPLTPPPPPQVQAAAP